MLAMPARRFWMMERQIDRITAESEIRRFQSDLTLTKVESKEHGDRIVDYIGQLTLEIGEKQTVRRNAIVDPEPSASAKFLKLTGGG